MSRDRDALALAEGFANHVVGWAREQRTAGSSLAILYEAAYTTSMATTAGDVCAHLDALGGLPDRSSLRQLLLTTGVVGTPEVPDAKPLILDGEGRLYLQRYFDYERRLAAQIRLRRAQTPAEAVPDRVKIMLGQLFAMNTNRGRPDWQKIAVAMALQNTLTIVSGGPGTGKTTTVTNLLACLLEQNPACRIALAAPTGKAAARMLDAIRSRATHLPVELQSLLPQESFTVHRLLGVSSTGQFRHHPNNPLDIDALVVDEASMLDLALATKLFEALPETARIVLLGDKDQLASVESGAVFAELSANPSLSASRIADLSALTGIAPDRIRPASSTVPAGISDSVIWFSENYRFTQDSGIGLLAQDINNGWSAQAIARLRESSDSTLSWIPDAGASLSTASEDRLVSGYARYLEAVRSKQGDTAAIFDALMRFRVLCSVREGPRGVSAVNKLVGNHFREKLDDPAHAEGSSEWYSGRPVIVRRNDYVLKIFNGDVGIALPDPQNRLTVFFPDGSGGFRSVNPVRLPEYETAFALTVHKAQGSEFDEAAFVLPAETNPGLTRELLYTAITRCRKAVTIVGGEELLEQAIQSPTRRHSGLIARLNETVLD